MKVLFAYKHPQAENPSACHVGMGVTASNTVMALREDRIEAEYWPVLNGEFLWAKLANEWASFTHVVLCAPYIDAPFLEKLAAFFPGKTFVLVYHSNLGFLSVDRFAARSLPLFLEVEARQRNFRVASNSQELADAVTAATVNPFLHLPNIYHLPHMTRRQREPWKPPMALHIGLFGAARVLKNWLTAVVAVMIVQRQLQVETHLHLNSGRDEGAEATRESLTALHSLNPQVNLVEVPWLSADDFHRYLYGMDLLLQPSFTETFNNVTADGCACGVPSVVSDAISWAPHEWKAKADSAASIAQTAIQILRDRNAASRGWLALDAHNQDALRLWRSWLGR